MIESIVTAPTVECIPLTPPPAGHSQSPCSQGLRAGNLGDSMRLIRISPGSTITVSGRQKRRARISFDGTRVRLSSVQDD